MLTLILLVVLCGVVGIIAVSMAERKPATNDDGSRRAGGAATAPRAVTPDPRSVLKSAPRRAPTPEDLGTVDSGTVPASQIAVEAPFGDLVRPSFPRRLISLVGLVLIVVAVGVGIAAVVGAVVGGAAEILGNAIG